nr:MAG TPA: hypothetical protein [Caudoviricetes sp.]DAY55698.1 MAG TPA: hypothetical protein [Caudoviricetes sp.]DAY79373.1 MAG TPA: hypothetical protein [Caudoviricetes sp.]
MQHRHAQTSKANRTLRKVNSSAGIISMSEDL